MSSFSAMFCAAAIADDVLEGTDWAPAAPPISERAKTSTAICAINLFSIRFMISSLSQRGDHVYHLASHGTRLGIDAALANRIRHAVNRQHVCRDPIVHVVSLSVANHVVK